MAALVQFKESSYQSYPKKLIIIKISTTKIRLHSTYSKLNRVLTLHLNTPHLYALHFQSFKPNYIYYHCYICKILSPFSVWCPLKGKRFTFIFTTSSYRQQCQLLTKNMIMKEL